MTNNVFSILNQFQFSIKSKTCKKPFYLSISKTNIKNENFPGGYHKRQQRGVKSIGERDSNCPNDESQDTGDRGFDGQQRGGQLRHRHGVFLGTKVAERVFPVVRVRGRPRFNDLVRTLRATASYGLFLEFIIWSVRARRVDVSHLPVAST